MDRDRLLKNLPPLIGLVVMVAAALILRRSAILAIPVGVLTWWAAYLLLNRTFGPGSIRVRDRRLAKLSNQALKEQLEGALAQASQLHDQAPRVPDPGMEQVLIALAADLEGWVAAAVSYPRRAGAQAPRLAPRLSAAHEMAARVTNLSEFGKLKPPDLLAMQQALELLGTYLRLLAERVSRRAAPDLDADLLRVEAQFRETDLG